MFRFSKIPGFRVSENSGGPSGCQLSGNPQKHQCFIGFQENAWGYFQPLPQLKAAQSYVIVAARWLPSMAATEKRKRAEESGATVNSEKVCPTRRPEAGPELRANIRPMSPPVGLGNPGEQRLRLPVIPPEAEAPQKAPEERMNVPQSASKHRKHGQTAFSILEVLVGAAIFGLGLVSLLVGLSTSFAFTRLAREDLRATQIMVERLETIRLYNWDQINGSNAFVIPTTFT